MSISKIFNGGFDIKKRKSNVIHVEELEDDFEKEATANPCEAPGREGSAKSRYWLESDGISRGDMLIEETHLFRLFKPMFLYMKYCGLFYINDSFQKRRRKKRSKFPKIYCICICLLVSLNFVRSLSGYSFQEAFGNVLLFKLLISCWWLECSTKAINAFINCYQKDRMFTFFVLFEKVCTEKSVERYRKWIKKWMIKSLFEATFFASFNVVGTAYAIFAVPELDVLFDVILAPFKPDSVYAMPLRGFNVFMQLVNSMVAMIPLAFYKVICLTLYKEFSLLSKDFSTRIDDEGTFHGDLEETRMRHQQLCKLTEAADSMFNFFIAAAFSANTPMLCILLYDLMYGHVHAAQTILLIFWLVFTLGHMAMISIFGTLINYTVSFFMIYYHLFVMVYI